MAVFGAPRMYILEIVYDYYAQASPGVQM